MYTSSTPTATDRWAMALVTFLWAFTRTMWNMKNTNLHGASVKEGACYPLQEQHDAIKANYEAFSDNPEYPILRHHHFFTSHSLEQHLQMHYVSDQCWLHSVDEAKQVHLLHDSILQEASAQFFPDPELSDTSSSSYTPSILHDNYSVLTATMVTTSSSYTSLDSDHLSLLSSDDDYSQSSFASTCTSQSCTSTG